MKCSDPIRGTERVLYFSRDGEPSTAAEGLSIFSRADQIPCHPERSEGSRHARDVAKEREILRCAQNDSLPLRRWEKDAGEFYDGPSDAGEGDSGPIFWTEQGSVSSPGFALPYKLSICRDPQ